MSAAVLCVHCLLPLTGDALVNAVEGACADQWSCITRQIRSRGAHSIPELSELLGANGVLVGLCRRWDARDDAVVRALVRSKEGAR